MATTVTKDRKTWSGSAKPTGREYSIDFLVKFDSPYSGPAAAVQAVALRIGSTYRIGADGDSTAFLKSLDPRCEDGNLWRVTAKWGPRDPEQDEQPNPIQRPTIWSYHPQPFQEVIWKDTDGKGIINSAGEYFDPPIEEEKFRPIITAKRNVPIFDDARADRFAGTLNKDTWKGRKPGTVRCSGISGDGPNFENGYTFYIETLEFQVKPEGWDLSILDQGRNRLVAGKLVPLNVYDENGNEILYERVADPIPLERIDAKNCRRLANPTPETVKFLTFRTKTRLNFNDLAL